MVSKDTQIVAVFVVLAVALWYGAMAVTEDTIIGLAILIGVGIIIPTIINEWRTSVNN